MNRHFRYSTLAFCLFVLSLLAQAQRRQPAPSLPAFTPGKDRIAAFEQRKKLQESSWFGPIAFKSIGPSIMGGRVVDLEVYEADPSIFFAAFASGGLWKTTNNGHDFTPLFDEQAAMTIGDIAVQWGNEGKATTIWVGTGENNSSRSSYAGTGIYRSNDEGKTWLHLGLEETHHIGRIVLHPTNPDIVWVAALGHLYSANPERGVYKTTDGGKSWNKTLFINHETGAIDLVVDPVNPGNIYAAVWEKSRTAWNFVEGGKNSGIYKSTDGGETWALCSGANSGFPASEGVGRIGLAIYPRNPSTLYAVLDNQEHRPEKPEPSADKIQTNALRSISSATFLEFDEKEVETYLRKNRFPAQYTGAEILNRIRQGSLKPGDLAEYLGSANNDLFNTPIKGAEVYRSDDAGKTWKKTHDQYLDDLVFTYGYYFSQIRVHPSNPEKLYTVGVPIITSDDGGKNWRSINGLNVHADHHAIWINPNRKDHLIIGNDGGVNITWDDGKTWFKANTIPTGQFYAIQVDMEEPYNVYGGLQDNGVWFGKKTYTRNDEWLQDGIYGYKFIMGGDGMQVEVDPRNTATVFTGFQFGYYYRMNKHTLEMKPITPKHTLGEKPFRFNWQTPIHLSRHNPTVLYMGSNKFHRSMDQGDTWQTFEPDLTLGGKPGDVPFGTLTTISESPLRFGLIYVGSDDGLVHVTRDGGHSWTRITNGLPPNFWVSRVEASRHQEGRVYLSLNGYRWDHFEPMVYVSDNYGATWQKLGANLPKEAVNVVREDPVNPDLLYVGTDHGIYASTDRGTTFMGLYAGLPAVAVHDLIVHPRDNELVVGTHGRSLYLADVAPLQELKPEVLAQNLYACTVKPVKYLPNWGKRYWKWGEPVLPGATVYYYAKKASTVSYAISHQGTAVHTGTLEARVGLNSLLYDLSIDEANVAALEPLLNNAEKGWKLEKSEAGKYFLLPGEYEVIFKMGEQETSTKLVIE
jgi:photosystem II stability/assembly factor-like uncharacterized protein